MSWLNEFPESYDVPDRIVQLEGITDFSWHNDTCPSFGREWRIGNSELQLRIWVAHPDIELREGITTHRFNVTSDAWDPPASDVPAIAGVPYLQGSDEDSWFGTDDIDAALAMFMRYVTLIDAALRAAA